ncbi:MAG: hypothetical protein J4400_01430 [Candidatus Aenigmarchaeota archaeon]|nr:hypothetical protein [Candidatus Aenigmarchaeota archaeon]
MIIMEDQEEEMFCNICGRKMKKRPVKTPLGSFDHWTCSFCQEMKD